MPEFNGIELLEYVKQFNKDIFVVLVTGYAKFEYAKRAIDLGVAGFVLKPISEEEISAFLCMTLGLSVMSGCGNKEEVKEESITFLSCWNGDSVRDYDGGESNPIWKDIYEKTGVKINVQYINVSEVEKLNQIFAAGTEADVISAPMWGMDDVCTQAIKKALEEELLMPLDDLVKEYAPNLEKSFTMGLTQDFIEYDLVPEAANGKHYILPSNVTPVEKRTYTFQDGIYVRKDILEATGFDISKIKTSEDVYEFMKDKEGRI